jgi:allophanate hydrolase
MPIGSVSSTTASGSFPDIASRVTAYEAGRDPARDLLATFDRIEESGLAPVWISLLDRDRAMSLLRAAQDRRARGERLPLFGIPFAVKDNIDVAGVPTTAGCPAFAYRTLRSATVVERLVAAGAIPIGKTNLDQFATGLNGTRSPYGIPTCAFDDALVSGGSSSGSAVAVARGLVPFALGTDTAGSGRIPAAFNNLIGLKPTKGLISTRGVLPACRTQDCVSIFAASAGDALAVLRAAAGHDPEDPFSRPAPASSGKTLDRPRFGVPAPNVLATCEPRIRAGHETAARGLESLGGVRVEIDLTPFLEAAALLYAGPWEFERLIVLTTPARFAGRDPSGRPRGAGGREGYDACDVFEGSILASAELRRQRGPIMATRCPAPPVRARIIQQLPRCCRSPDPAMPGSGTFTNFVNLLDSRRLRCPRFRRARRAGRREPRRPGLRGRALAHLADRCIGRSRATLEANRRPGPPPGRSLPAELAPRGRLAVVGAHLSGQPLNWQLTERGGVLEGPCPDSTRLQPLRPPRHRSAETRARLRRRPGRDRGRDLEPAARGLRRRRGEIPSPLGIGSLALEDGSAVQGFLCESYAVAGAHGHHRVRWMARLPGLAQPSRLRLERSLHPIPRTLWRASR